MKKTFIICWLVLLTSGIFIGCAEGKKLINEINTKQNEIISLLEEKKSEKLSEMQLKDIESKISKLKEELKSLEEKYNKK